MDWQDRFWNDQNDRVPDEREKVGNSWPEQDAIDEFFSHAHLLPLKKAVTKYRVIADAKVNELRDLLRECEPFIAEDSDSHAQQLLFRIRKACGD